jgi:periplasmic protein TonB
MANKDSYYSRSKYRKKYDLQIAFLFSLFVLLFLLGVMYFFGPHEQYYSTSIEVQIPVEMGKVEDMIKVQLPQSSPPEDFSQPSISMVEEIAAKVTDQTISSKDTLTKPNKDSLDNKLTNGGGARTKAEAEIEDALPFSFVEEKPEYHGGNEALLKFLGENLKYPHLAKESAIFGIVIVQFVIEKDGSVGEVKVVRGLGGGCNEEAIRVMNMMPKWTPGKQHGKVVRVYFQIPLKFNLRPG